MPDPSHQPPTATKPVQIALNTRKTARPIPERLLTGLRGRAGESGACGGAGAGTCGGGGAGAGGWTVGASTRVLGESSVEFGRRRNCVG